MKRVVAVLLAKFPHLELLLRRIYRRYFPRFQKLRKRFQNGSRMQPVAPAACFDRIIDVLRQDNHIDGRLLVVHSSYEALLPTGLDCEEILKKLETAVGPEGTLAMPIIRKYKEEGALEDYLTRDLSNITCRYNVRKTKVSSGALPYCMLLTNPAAKISRFPLNPLIAVGKHAEAMMSHNIDADGLSPHGVHSGWKYCCDHNALIVGLGIRMTHYLTMMHVSEEAYPWPVSPDDWFRKRKFVIVDGEFQKELTVLERKPIWGATRLAEYRLEHDLMKAGILVVREIDGITVSTLESQKLIAFLRGRASSGYPYLIPKKFLTGPT